MFTKYVPIYMRSPLLHRTMLGRVRVRVRVTQLYPPARAVEL